jgi:hypothetical protein
MEQTVNAISYDFPDRIRPLDGAVENGRLEMVKFLLNTNAISGEPGQTGYDALLTRTQVFTSPRYIPVIDVKDLAK